jgi:calcium-dependent protein kinase
MWSVGVILYILLSGTPPFDDNTLFDQIRTASYSFQGQEWEGVSDEAKDLVRKLLTTSPVTRLKADQVGSTHQGALSL